MVSHREISLGLQPEDLSVSAHHIPTGSYTTTTSYAAVRDGTRFIVRATMTFEVLRGWTAWETPGGGGDDVVPPHWGLHWPVFSLEGEEAGTGRLVSRSSLLTP